MMASFNLVTGILIMAGGKHAASDKVTSLLSTSFSIICLHSVKKSLRKGLRVPENVIKYSYFIFVIVFNPSFKKLIWVKFF